MLLSPLFNLFFVFSHFQVSFYMNNCLIAGLLCVGDVAGVMKLYYLKWQEAELSCISATDLWSHKDNIQVKRFCTVSTNNSEITIVAAKGSFLIAITLNAECRVERVKPFHVGNLSINGRFYHLQYCLSLYEKGNTDATKIGIKINMTHA